ncbi:hypothetical protein FE634_21645 [Nocardioides dongxiaopingii]|uniref:SCO7613 C-terminal domain-containing membrane protein n=1 Tax=Nocardioides sp. S-1144 TaxID=2582905 RepID=UPI001163603D|nr:hypothetical protein [Nocardioides sp. S-1144]QDH10812.1 hypothetical protein FE634_21645 [Nocardioides sp. S-1144]
MPAAAPAHLYADPRSCPSCRGSLVTPTRADRLCRHCGVPLDHELAVEAFAALQDVDRLTGRLRLAAAAPVTAPVPAVPVAPRTPVPVWTSSLPEGPGRTGVRTSSVPAILLGLGALCLLVAAVAFLAVAWSWLGVGGRTAVLVGLTAATGVGGVLLRRRDLRVAAEAIVTVALGLLLLDVLGARGAGWLGDPTGAGLACALGAALAVGGGVLWAVERRLAVPSPALVAGLFVVQAALPSLEPLEGAALPVAGLAVLGFTALAALGQRAGRTALVVSSAVAAVAAWCDLLGTALVGVLTTADRAGALTVAGLWGSADGVALAAAALLLLAPLAVRRPRHAVVGCLAAAGTALTAVAVLPVLDDGVTRVAVASLVAGALWAAAAHAAPLRLRIAAVVPGALSLVPSLAIALGLVLQALDAATAPDDDLRLDPSGLLASPWLVVPTMLVALALLLTVLAPRPLGAWVRGSLAAVAAGATTTLSLHPVPLWTVVVAVCVVAVALAVEALRRDGAAALVQVLGAGAALAGAAGLALPDAGLLLLPLALLTAAAAAVLVLGRFPAAAGVGGLALGPATAALLWTTADVVGLDPALAAVPVLVVLGALAVLLPRPVLEVPAVVVALLAAAAAVPLAGDVAVSLALHLTLAGALVTASALVHRSRRALAWVGTALLVLATWVRLADLGVQAPEPYTLPTAVALVLLGLHRLSRDGRASTRTTLLPGLGLALVPSLLQLLVGDPVSLRALLLGAACLALVLAGARLRWSAPLVVGAVVGALLTLVELSPYAARTPQWVTIGLAGTLLVVVGVTWERRVVDLRRAATYVGRLR